jgi:DNA adenine methylase
MVGIRAKPFLKWAGGKTQLLKQFESYYPASLKLGKIKKYIEPFIGSGAVFLEICQKHEIESVYISDINSDLIQAYQVIQKWPDDLIEILGNLQTKFSESSQIQRQLFFAEVRSQFNLQRKSVGKRKLSKDAINRTAQLIFLNKTCFNGLFRLNSKGEFNVPFGRYKNPKILDTENIYQISRLLHKTEIRSAEFESCYAIADEYSFIYFDPPYRPISKTANFTSYARSGFSDREQEKLADFYRKLDREKAAKLMLSNSDPKNENIDDDFFERLYEGYYIHRVLASRTINSIGAKRGRISELLIVNYQN